MNFGKIWKVALSFEGSVLIRSKVKPCIAPVPSSIAYCKHLHFEAACIQPQPNNMCLEAYDVQQIAWQCVLLICKETILKNGPMICSCYACRCESLQQGITTCTLKFLSSPLLFAHW